MSDTLKVTDIGYRLFSLNVAAPIPSEETFSLSSLSSLCFYWAIFKLYDSILEEEEERERETFSFPALEREDARQKDER